MEALKNNSIKYARRRAVLYVAISMYLIYKMLGSEYKVLFLLPALFFIAWAIFEYNKDLAKKFKKNLNEFLEIKYNTTKEK